MHLVCSQNGDVNNPKGLFFRTKSRNQVHTADETEGRLVASHLTLIGVGPAQNKLT